MKKYNIELSKMELELLISIHKGCKDKKNAYKLNAIILLAKGYSYQQIEDALLISERHIRRLKNMYQEKGVDALLQNNYKGSNSNLSNNQLKELSDHLEQSLYSSAIDICNYVSKTFAIKYSAETMVQLLKRLGFSYKKTKIVPGKANKKDQEAFVKNYEETRNNLKNNEKIYFIDAVHPTHNVMPSYVWIKKGMIKEIKSNTGRQRLNINGVYSPIDNEIIVRSDDTINAQSTIKLFQTIERKHPELKKIIIYGDRARYYTAKIVKEYLENSRIHLVHLPAYSPNLNLIERLWKLLKKKTMYNKYYEDFDKFKESVMGFFNNNCKNYIDELRSLLTENFHIFETS